ncbi:MAG: ABC transporter permease [Anaerolineaceae bacterium]|nr:ABC transporter permease [Anaerolineaceae bacterium]
MKQLVAIYSAELLKLKRTIAFLLTILIPVLLIILIIFMVLDRGLENYNKEMFNHLLNFTFSIWPMIVMPMFLSIATGLIGSMETTTGQWKHIFCLPIPKWKILFTKWLAIITLTFVSHAQVVLLFLGSFPIIQLFVPQVSYIPFMDTLDFLWFLIILCVASVGLTSIHFVFSLIFPGLVGNIGLGISAVTLSMGLTWAGNFFQFFPWTVPLAALANFVELDTSFMPITAMLISLITAIIWLLPGIRLFSRKDIL